MEGFVSWHYIECDKITHSNTFLQIMSITLESHRRHSRHSIGPSYRSKNHPLTNTQEHGT